MGERFHLPRKGRLIRLCSQIRKIEPQRHRDTEKNTEKFNTFSVFFSVSLCLCGSIFRIWEQSQRRVCALPADFFSLSRKDLERFYASDHACHLHHAGLRRRDRSVRPLGGAQGVVALVIVVKHVHLGSLLRQVKCTVGDLFYL